MLTNGEKANRDLAMIYADTRGILIVQDGVVKGSGYGCRVHSLFRLLHGALQNAELMAKRDDLKLQRRSSSEKRQRCGKQRR